MEIVSLQKLCKKREHSSFSRYLTIFFSNVGHDFFYKTLSPIFTKAYVPYLITASHFVVQKYVITAWRIGGGVHDEQQQLKAAFGA